MCELLALSFNLPVNPQISFTGFIRRGHCNPHGWGLGYYPDESAQIFKEPIQSEESNLAQFLANYNRVRSRLFLGHGRLASKGGQWLKNTQPFLRHFGDREYIFAHNGTIVDLGDLGGTRFIPVGDTDSEQVFCHLLERI